MGRLLKILCLFFLVFISCKQADQSSTETNFSFKKINGQTMGTSYHITVSDSNNVISKNKIDSILIDINNAVSTYIPSSTISQINNDALFEEKEILNNGQLSSTLRFDMVNDQHFLQNFEISKHIYKMTDGYFDPTVMPLVNFWGFGYSEKKAVENVDSAKVNNLSKLVGFDKWTLNKGRSHSSIIKKAESQLDFSAVAKGYGVDVISDYIKSFGIKDFMVEIGGEVFAHGKNENGNVWRIGLSTPVKSAAPNDYSGITKLSGQALASSGNYRNYYDVNGTSYGHEINPKTGYPEINEILGASVIAQNCAEADAYATAFMVMGLQNAVELVDKLDYIEACFFYRDSSNAISKAFSKQFENYFEELPSN